MVINGTAWPTVCRLAGTDTEATQSWWLGISKRGDAYLRTLMVYGARSALRTAKSKEDRLSQWAVRLAERSYPNVAVIALANKTARMAWAMLRYGTDYQPNQAAA